MLDFYYKNVLKYIFMKSFSINFLLWRRRCSCGALLKPLVLYENAVNILSYGTSSFKRAPQEHLCCHNRKFILFLLRIHCIRFVKFLST